MFNRFKRYASLATLLILSNIAVSAHAASYAEGIEYLKINPAVSTTVDKGQIEVVELFWYMCPHCFRFEPDINEWKKTKPKNVVFKRVPAIFSPRWRFFAKVYYTIKLLGIEDKIHAELFNELHEKRARLSNEAAMAKFIEKHAGIKKKKFMDVFNSFSVDAKVRKAEDLSKRYQAQGVPTLIVNGKWRTGGSIAGGHKGMIKVLNHLIKIESK